MEDNRLDIDNLDHLLGSLQGVISARTVLDEGKISDIHILGDETKSPKQLVRDVKSAVMARLGLDIDYKVISVAQVNSRLFSTEKDSPKNTNRLHLERISTALENKYVETTVDLGDKNKRFSGSNRSLIASNNFNAAAAEACLMAIKEYLEVPCHLKLVDIQNSKIAGQNCICVAIALEFGTHEGFYYGMAPIKSQDLEVKAAAMAVLSALNRVIGIIKVNTNFFMS